MIYVFPGLLLLVGLLYYSVRASHARSQFFVFDLGDVFFFVVFIYGIVPGIGLLLDFLGVGYMLDSRLADGFDYATVEYVQWMYLALLCGFSVAYIFSRRPTAPRRSNSIVDEARLLAVPLIVLAFLTNLSVGAINAIWGTQQGDDYISSYIALRNAPRIIQQVFGVITQLQISTTIAAIVAVVASRPRLYLIVAATLGINALLVVLSGGARSFAFLSIFAYLVSCSIFVQGFTKLRVIALGIPALTMFMIAGVLRDESLAINYLNVFQTGEFTAVFVTAIDLSQKFSSGMYEEVRYTFYLVDLFRFVPAQLLPVEKLDLATWYVSTFYQHYHEAGGGFAFGVLSESASGFGIPEAAARGALLGLFFATCANRLTRGALSFQRAFFYIWLVVFSYVCYRDTTFSIAIRALYQVVPVLVFTMMFRRRWNNRTIYSPRLR